MLINLILFFSWQASCARIIYLCSLKSDGSVPHIFIPLKNMWHLKFCNHKKSRIKRHRGPLESNSVLCHECKPPLDLAQGLWHVWCPSAVCQVVTEAHLSLVNNHHERERVRAIGFHEILETGAIHKETRKKFFDFFLSIILRPRNVTELYRKKKSHHFLLFRIEKLKNMFGSQGRTRVTL